MNKVVVDTNVIVGFLVRGDDLFEKSLQKFETLYLSVVVIFECVYVLEKVYKLEREEIVGALSRIVQIQKIESERNLILNVLLKYRDIRGLGIVDCYLLQLAEEMKCRVLTEDANLLKLVK